MSERLSDADVAAIGRRIATGCPTSLKGLSVAPWVLQLQADARRLLEEVERQRKDAGRAAA